MIALALVVVFAAGGTDSSAGGTSASPSPGGVIYRVGSATEIDSLNPFAGWNFVPCQAFRACYSYLTLWDQDYQPVPDLAETVPTVENGGITEGGRVWTFRIRPNVKWSDGTPLTARDVVYTFNRIIRQELYMHISYFVGVTKVEAPDDLTVVITSENPNAVLNALYVPILPEHIWKDVPDGKVESYANVPMVSSGPYYVAEAKRGKYVKLVRNPYYAEGFGVDPAVDEFYLELYRTEDSLLADYKTGHLDAAWDIGASRVTSVKDMPGSTWCAAPTLGFHMLAFNCFDSPKSKGNPLLLDKRIRQAANWAIDREAISEVAMGGLAPVGSTIISPIVGSYHYEVPEASRYSFDPAKARQMLNEAGYASGADGVRATPDGKPLRFRLAAFNQYPSDVAAAKMIVSYLKDVGIQAELQVMDENAFTDLNYDYGDCDLWLWSWVGDVDPGYLLRVFLTEQILNTSDSNYSNPEYDELYAQQAQAIDPAQRQEIVRRMQEILYEDAPYAVLWYNVNIQAYRTDRWEGYTLVPRENGAPFRNMLRDSYVKVRPKVAETASSDGSRATWIVAAIIVALAVIVAIVVVIRRRAKPRTETL